MKSIKYLLATIVIFPLTMFAFVGEIKVSNGDVLIERAGKTIKGACNAKIEEKDAIFTKARSNAQVVFLDGTVVSMGQNTNFNIQEYLYDEKSNNVKFKAGVVKGAFKAITGRIGKISPEKFKLETRTATIGIRGTRFLGFMANDGADTIACTEGVIAITPLSTTLGAPPPETIELKAGEITRVSDGKAETPRKYKKEEIREIEMSTGRSCNCK